MTREKKGDTFNVIADWDKMLVTIRFIFATELDTEMSSVLQRKKTELERGYVKLFNCQMALFNLSYTNNPDFTTLRDAAVDGMTNKVIKSKDLLQELNLETKLN